MASRSGCISTWSRSADIVAAFRLSAAAANSSVASYQGNGFVVPEDECLGDHRKEQAGAEPQGPCPNEARTMTAVEGDTVAVIGDNRKMVIFPLDQVPEMTRGTRRAPAALSSTAGCPTSPPSSVEAALSWVDGRRPRADPDAEGAQDWRGNRADAGAASAPKGYAKNNKFRGAHAAAANATPSAAREER